MDTSVIFVILATLFITAIQSKPTVFNWDDNSIVERDYNEPIIIVDPPQPSELQSNQNQVDEAYYYLIVPPATAKREPPRRTARFNRRSPTPNKFKELFQDIYDRSCVNVGNTACANKQIVAAGADADFLRNGFNPGK